MDLPIDYGRVGVILKGRWQLHMALANRSVIRWIPVSLLGLAVAFSLFGDMAMYTILPTYYVELGLTPLQVGLVLSVNRWIRLLTNRIAGGVLRQGNTKLFLTIALLLGSGLSVIYAITPPFWILLIARVLWGACWSFIRHAGVMSSLSLGPRENSGRVMGTFQGLVQIGFIAGTLSGGFLFDLIGFSRTFVVMCLISIVSIPFELAGLRRHREAMSGKPAEHGDPKGGGVSIFLSVKGFIVACVGSGLIMSTLGYVLKSELGESISIGTAIIGISTLNGVLLALRNAILSVGAVFAGIILDRTKRGPVERTAFALAALILGAAAFLMRSAYIIPLIVLFFVISTFLRVALISGAGIRGPKVYATFVSASDLGAATGPLLGWIGIDAARDPKTIFLAGFVLYLVALILPAREVGRQ